MSLWAVVIGSFIGSFLGLVTVLIPVYYFLKKKVRNFNPLMGGIDKS